jgi:hypothetical protein
LSEVDLLETFLSDLRRAGRFAPRPQAWDGFWKLLKKGFDRNEWPPAPLILAAHWSTTAQEKHNRLTEQLRWAELHHLLSDALKYMNDLDSEDWKPIPYTEWGYSAGSI